MKILTDVQEARVSIEWPKDADFRPEIIGGKGILSDIGAAVSS